MLKIWDTETVSKKHGSWTCVDKVLHPEVILALTLMEPVYLEDMSLITLIRQYDDPNMMI